MKLSLEADDRLLLGSVLPRWYGVAYRKYECRTTILCIIPLNLVVRYSVGLYWVLYRWIKHGHWDDKLDSAYWRGYNDCNQWRDKNDNYIVESLKKAFKGG